MPQISVRNLSKTFSVSVRKPGIRGSLRGLVRREIRTVRALNGVSFTIDQGELVGYIGPNGAGKSTTVKILAGILVPDSGECTISGKTPWKERIAHVSRIGVVFGQRSQLWWDLPVVESFDLLREIYRIPASEERQTRQEIVELLGLAPLLDVPVRQLSLGWRMRCELAASLLHRPDILFLDEPTIGLDAVSKLAVREFLRRLNESRKVTIILTTHDMDDIEALCSRIIVIGAGEIMFDGTVEMLRRRIRNERKLTIDLQTAQYPISIFPEGMRRFFTFVVPLACVNYFPILLVLGKPDPFGSPRWFQAVSPAAGLFFLQAAVTIWRMGIRRYSSTGS